MDFYTFLYGFILLGILGAIKEFYDLEVKNKKRTYTKTLG
jgi:hypothetical protein